MSHVAKAVNLYSANVLGTLISSGMKTESAGLSLKPPDMHDLSSTGWQPVVPAAALPEEFLKLLMWAATMAWEAGETRWEWLHMNISE